MINPLELVDIVDAVIEFVPDIRVCMVNWLWTSRIMRHNDYKQFWRKSYRVNAKNIVRYGSISMMDLCHDVVDLFLNSADHGKLDFVKALIDYPQITMNIKQEAYKHACISCHFDIIEYLKPYFMPINISMTCIDDYAKTGKMLYLALFIIKAENLQWPNTSCLNKLGYNHDEFKLISSIHFTYYHYEDVLTYIITLSLLSNNIQLFKLLYKLVDLSQIIKDYHYTITRYDCLITLQYLFNKGRIMDITFNLNNLLYTGNAKVVHYLTDIKAQTYGDVMLPGICKSRYLSSVKYAWNNIPGIRQDADDAMNTALKECNVLVVKYLHEEGVPISYNNFHIVAARNNTFYNSEDAYSMSSHYNIINLYALIKYLHSINVDFALVYRKLCKVAVAIGDIKLLKFLFETVGIITDICIVTLYRFAKMFNNSPTVEYLLNKINNDNLDLGKIRKIGDTTCLSVGKLIKYGITDNIHNHSDYIKGTAFIYAVIYNNIELTQSLFNDVDVFHKTLAYVYACVYGHLSTAVYLREHIENIKNRPTVIYADTIYETASIEDTVNHLRIDSACRMNVIWYNNKANNVVNGFNWGNVIIADTNNHPTLSKYTTITLCAGSVRYLIYLSDNLNASNYELVRDAVQRGHISIVKYLYNYEKFSDADNVALIRYACRYNHNDVLAYLCDQLSSTQSIRCDPNYMKSQLIHAVTCDNSGAVDLLCSWVDVDKIMMKKLLWKAIKLSKYNVVKYFHERRFNIRMDNDHVMTVACRHNYYTFVKYLHKSGIPLNINNLESMLSCELCVNIRLLQYFTKHGLRNDASDKILGMSKD